MLVENLPGPRGLETFGFLSRLRKNYALAYQGLYESYGERVFMKTPFKAVFLFDPNDIQIVLKKNAKSYRKSDLYSKYTTIFGKGLVTSEGDLWKAQRRAIAPVFHFKTLETFTAQIEARGNEFVRDWKTRTPGFQFDVAESMMELTFRIVGDTLFGADFSHEASEMKEAIYSLLSFYSDRTLGMRFLPMWVPTPLHRKIRRSEAHLQQVAHHALERGRKNLENKKNSQERSDVLSRLLLWRDPKTGEPMPQQQIIDEVQTLMIAGHETTSLSLTWTWYLLSQNPEVQQRFQEEVDQLSEEPLESFDEVYAKLPYTKRVLQEAMRMIPPVPAISRNAIEENQVNDLTIQPDTVVQLCPFVTHHIERLWPEHDRFDPDRFLEAKNKERLDFAYFPFAGGPRACLGEHFSMLEAMILMARIGKSFEFKREEKKTPELEAATTLRPKGPLWMTAQPRSSTDQIRTDRFHRGEDHKHKEHSLPSQL